MWLVSWVLSTRLRSWRLYEGPRSRLFLRVVSAQTQSRFDVRHLLPYQHGIRSGLQPAKVTFGTCLAAG